VPMLREEPVIKPIREESTNYLSFHHNFLHDIAFASAHHAPYQRTRCGMLVGSKTILFAFLLHDNLRRYREAFHICTHRRHHHRRYKCKHATNIAHSQEHSPSSTGFAVQRQTPTSTLTQYQNMRQLHSIDLLLHELEVTEEDHVDHT